MESGHRRAQDLHANCSGVARVAERHQVRAAHSDLQVRSDRGDGLLHVRRAQAWARAGQPVGQRLREGWSLDHQGCRVRHVLRWRRICAPPHGHERRTERRGVCDAQASRRPVGSETDRNARRKGDRDEKKTREPDPVAKQNLGVARHQMRLRAWSGRYARESLRAESSNPTIVWVDGPAVMRRRSHRLWDKAALQPRWLGLGTFAQPEPGHGWTAAERADTLPARRSVEIEGGPMQHLMTIDSALQELLDAGGSDIVISAGSRQRMRKDGRLTPLDPNSRVMSPIDTERIVREVLNSHQWEELGRLRHVDFAFTWRENARIRGNAYYQRGTLAVAFRLLPLAIPTFEQLGLPEVVHKLLARRQGLVLVTISAALTVAETGHLVLATLHTNDAPQAVDRIVDAFSGAQQQQVRVQLGACLAGVIYQQLMPAQGGGRVAAFEILMANVAV